MVHGLCECAKGTRRSFDFAQDDSLYLPLRMTIGQWGALAFSFGSLKTGDRRDVPSAIGQ